MKRYNALITELSKATLGSYIKKAGHDNVVNGIAMGGNAATGKYDEAGAAAKKASKRHQGVAKAVQKLVKENETIQPVLNARSPADKEFSDAHPAEVTPDANGNGDDVFKGKTTKDTSRRADKWTGDDDADDAESETGLDTAGKYHTEDVQLQEISRKVLGSYIKKAANEVGFNMSDHGAAATRAGYARSGSNDELTHTNDAHKARMKAVKRFHGIQKASDKLVKEGEELQELSKRTLGRYVKKAARSMSQLDRKHDKLDASDSAVNGAGVNASDEVRNHLQSARDSLRKDMRTLSNKSNNRADGIHRAIKQLTKEDLDQMGESEFANVCENFEQLDELSKKTLGSYIMHATQSYANHQGLRDKHKEDAQAVGRMDYNASEPVRKSVRSTVDTLHTAANKHDDKRYKRGYGIQRAVQRLTKEDLDQMNEEEFADVCENFEQLDEISKATLGSYIKKAHGDSAANYQKAHDHNQMARNMSSDENITRHFDAARSHYKKHLNREKGIPKAVDKLTKEDVTESSDTSVSPEGSGLSGKVHVSTGDTKHTVQRKRTMSSSHYVVHDHKSGNNKTFPYASDVAAHLNDSGHQNLHSKHFQSLY